MYIRLGSLKGSTYVSTYFLVTFKLKILFCIEEKLQTNTTVASSAIPRPAIEFLYKHPPEGDVYDPLAVLPLVELEVHGKEPNVSGATIRREWYQILMPQRIP